MKKGKRVAVRFPIEYRLLITPKYKEREKQTVTRVALRTVNEFSNFRYEIIVEDHIEDRTMLLKIHGLRAPKMTLPSMGPAIFSTEYSSLKGKYTVIISKLDKEENAFTVDISEHKVVLEESPKKHFVDVVTTEEDW